MIPSLRRKPAASSSSWPGVRIVTAMPRPRTRNSSGSSAARTSVALRALSDVLIADEFRRNDALVRLAHLTCFTSRLRRHPALGTHLPEVCALVFQQLQLARAHCNPGRRRLDRSRPVESGRCLQANGPAGYRRAMGARKTQPSSVPTSFFNLIRSFCRTCNWCASNGFINTASRGAPLSGSVSP